MSTSRSSSPGLILGQRAGLPAGGASQRSIVGIRIGSQCQSATAALVTIQGRGEMAAPHLVAMRNMALDGSLRAEYQRVASGGAQAAGEFAELAAGLADSVADLTLQLLGSLPSVASDVLLAGVHEPGLWHVGRGVRPTYAGLCDAARLAQRTGLNVIDAFPARDLAAGGQGGPVLAVPLWMLLGDPRRPRLLLDLGRTARLTYLPSREAQSADKIAALDAGPGTILLDTLAEQFTSGSTHFDPGGTLAVQGRRIHDLIEHWLADPYFHRPPPRWYPLGVRPHAELQQTVHMAIESGWTVRDLLCTATHFIAEAIARAVKIGVPQTPPIAEMLVTGGGAHNGFLLAEISRRLPGVPLRKATDVLAGDETLEAAATAMLAMMFVDRVPGTWATLTGATAPQVLGRLTPGSPENWKRLTPLLAATPSGATVLRNAS